MGCWRRVMVGYHFAFLVCLMLCIKGQWLPNILTKHSPDSVHTTLMLLISFFVVDAVVPRVVIRMGSRNTSNSSVTLDYGSTPELICEATGHPMAKVCACVVVEYLQTCTYPASGLNSQF